MGVAALILGIIAIVFAIIPGLGWIGAIIGVIGIVLGAVAKKSDAKMATGGLVLSIIGTALGLILYLSCVYCASKVGGELEKAGFTTEKLQEEMKKGIEKAKEEAEKAK